jgi:anoctamin-8
MLLRTCIISSLLRAAEELCIRKPVKSEYGGGIKEFVVEDQEFFIGVDDAKGFFTSQERQSIVRHLLFNLRAHQGDTLGSIRFLEGQAISKLSGYIERLVLMCK